MDNSEKNIESMGMEGKQATLPNESSTHEEDRDWSQGRESIPLDIIHSINENCIVDSIHPTTDFNSVVSCSNSITFNLSLFVNRLLLINRSRVYISVGNNGKNRMKTVIEIIDGSTFSLLLKNLVLVDKM